MKKYTFKRIKFIVISQRELRLRNPFQWRFRDRYFFVPTLARDRGAQHERIERRVRARRPANGFVLRGAARRGRGNGRRKIEMTTGRFLTGRRDSLLVTGSDAGLGPGTRRSRRFPLSLSLSLSLSSLTVYIAAIDRGDRSCGIRSTVMFHNHRFLHTYISLFSVRVCQYETRSRWAKGKETEAETVKRSERERARKRERENCRVRDGALHAHTDRDLRAVSGNRE